MGYTYTKNYALLTKIEIDWASSLLSGNTNTASSSLILSPNLFFFLPHKTEEAQPLSRQIFFGQPGSAYIWHSNLLSEAPSVCFQLGGKNNQK